MMVAFGLLLASSIHAAGPAPTPIPVPQMVAAAAASPRKTRDIVVLQSERWIDTVRGTVRNVGPRDAEEVVLDVRLRNARRTVLGTETVRVGPLRSGEEREFQLSLPEKLRSAARWEIVPRAAFGPKARKG